MSTVSIHIEGHEDGVLDFPEDLAAALRHIADRLDSGNSGERDNEFPVEVVLPYVGNVPVEVDPEDDDEERATWSVQYSRY